MVTISRKELYSKVWETPITKLSKAYDLSDVGFKKICKKLNVPTPPRGYWARLASGVRVEKIPLPSLKPGDLDTYELNRYAKQEVKQKAEISRDEYLPVEIRSIRPVRVPKTLSSPHPLVEKTYHILKKVEPDKYGALRPWNEENLDIRVSPKSLNRALRILDGIIKGLAKSGYAVTIEKDRFSKCYTVIHNEKVYFYINEKFDRIEHQLTEKDKKELKRWSYAHIEKWDYLPTGKLTLGIESWNAGGHQTKWSDTRNKQVEDSVHDFLISLFKIGYIERQRTIAREIERQKWLEEQQRRAEEAQKRELEQKQLLELERLSDSWAKSRQLRAFIDAVRAKAALEGQTQEFTDRLDKWTSWANQYADQLDPLSGGFVFFER